MEALISIEALGLSAKGKIREVIPAVDSATRTFLIKIAVTNKGLRSGLFARVRLPRGEREALVVPKWAIIEKGQLTGLYVVEANGIVTYRLVRAGKVSESGIEVLSGLNPGEHIITAGLERAIDGGRIAEETAK